MSAFDETNWPPNCSTANQSPINLTQSQAKPCNLTCDLVMDDGNVMQATISVDKPGLMMTGNLGSCKFKGESYVCTSVIINHPSHHTVEGVQADGEVVAYFKKPTGENLCISTLFRVNTAQTPSFNFFKQIVPYALAPGEDPTKVALQKWSLTQMVPPAGSYFVYSGSFVDVRCTSTEWIVFKSMINMDTDDFAKLVRVVPGGSRAIKQTGERQVFFNDTQNIQGVMPHDNKYYLRLRPTGNTKINQKKSSASVDLKNNVKEPSILEGETAKYAYKQVEENGGWVKTLILVLIVAAVLYGLWLGWTTATNTPFKAVYAWNFAVWVRTKAKEFYEYLEKLTEILTPRALKKAMSLKKLTTVPLPPILEEKLEPPEPGLKPETL